ncbi:hypothetical protein QVD17_34886 [Tagetes erecta]|uniref:Uncharacterized protein n=1 Tax=Tagetes erecta TaxID=13708 RepID=A0AAD8NKN7_TARER|nr:hypothetical protein QVD17_34886 [Tagetes erecta]
MGKNRVQTPSSPAPIEVEDTLESQNLLKELVKEICKFTDPEIQTLVPCVPFRMIPIGVISSLFVKRNSISEGETLPIKWVLKGTPRSKAPMFVLDDVDNLLTFKFVKKEEKTTVGPATKRINNRCKSIAYKRRKTSEPRDDFADMQKGLIEYIS